MITSRKSKTPAAIEKYFSSTDPKYITSVYYPDRGWKPLPGNWKVSLRKLRNLYSIGALYVQVRCGQRLADFAIVELF